MFVAGVIVHDQVQIEFGRYIAVDVLEETKEFLMTVALLTTVDDFSGGDVQGRKQGRRSMPDIVVRDAFHIAQSHRQHGLGSLQYLALTLFVDTEDNGIFRGIQI